MLPQPPFGEREGGFKIAHRHHLEAFEKLRPHLQTDAELGKELE
jgi:hypothetical protein